MRQLDSSVEAIAAGDDNAAIVAITRSGSIYFWSSFPGEPRVVPGERPGAMCLRLAPKNLLVGVGYNDGSLELLDIEAGGRRHRFEPIVPTTGHAAGVLAVEFNADGTHVSAGSGLQRRVFETLTGNEIVGLRRNIDGSPLRFMGADLVLAQADDGALALSHIGSGSVVARFEHPQNVNAYALNREQSVLVTGGGDGSLSLWQSPVGQSIRRERVGFPIAAIAVDGKQEFIAIRGGNGALAVGAWNGGNYRVCGKVSGWAFPIVLSRDGSLVAGMDNQSIMVCGESLTGGMARIAHDGEVVAVEIAPNRSWLAAAIGDGHLRVLRLPDGTKEREIDLPSRPTCLQMSRQDSRLFVGTDHEVLACDTKAWNIRPICSKGAVLLALSHDARWIALANSRVAWVTSQEPAAGASPIGPFDHGATIRSLALTGDGRMLATGGEDRVVRLWDVDTCRLFGRLELESWPMGLVFQDSGDAVVLVASSDALAWVPYQVHGLLDLAKGRIPFVPSPDEWEHNAGDVPYPGWMRRR